MNLPQLKERKIKYVTIFEKRKKERKKISLFVTFYTHKLHIHIVKLKKVGLIIIYDDDESVSIRSFPSSNSHLRERFAWCLSFSLFYSCNWCHLYRL